MPKTDSQSLTLQFTEQSMSDLFELAKELETNPAGVVGQALALLKIAQGRQIILKRGTQNLQIDKYASHPAQLDPAT